MRNRDVIMSMMDHREDADVKIENPLWVEGDPEDQRYFEVKGIQEVDGEVVIETQVSL